MTETNSPTDRRIFLVQLALILANFVVAGLFFLIPVVMQSRVVSSIQPYLYVTGSMNLMMSFVFLWPRKHCKE